MADGQHPSDHRQNITKMALCPSFTIRLLIIAIIYSVCLDKVCVSSLKSCQECDQGRCINETCTCLPGWRGINCDECYGRISLPPGKEGVIHDGSANYSKDITCSWLLAAEQENMRVRLLINDFATECIWDHLYVHDGDSAFAPLVSVISGIMWDLKDKPEIKFKLSGKYAFIHFYSDAALTLPGFNISYFIDSCSLECSNGICNNSVCECKPGWKGVNCDSLISECPFNCSNHGQCMATGGCNCSDNYTGLNECTNILSNECTNILVFRYSINSKNWIAFAEPGPIPWPRYGHTAVFHKGALYLYGGVKGTMIMKDLWMYNITSGTWSTLASCPRSIFGHTSHVVNDKVLVIFGYSPDYGYSNEVFEYSIATNAWSVAKHVGSLVQGTYGHTSVFDTDRQKIYVYGGYQSSSTYQHTDQLYQYDPYTNEWYILQGSGSAQYLHSAAMMNGLMLVFGGNTHNDTQISKQCFASDFMIYDRSTFISYFFGRLSSLSSLYCSTVYIFGGFNSFLKTDLLIIREGNCTFYKNQDACESAIPGIKCQWVNNQCVTNTNTTCHSKDSEAKCLGYNTCSSCQNTAGCHWCGGLCTSSPATTPNCSMVCTQKVCSDQHSCENCTSAQCMWCSNLAQCIDTNAYVVSFHYGQCMGWITKAAACNGKNTSNNCSTLATCADCQARPKCECQCNGHSTCLNGSSTCEKCQFPTTGPQCQYCSDGYYGNPENGGKCTPCFCNGQADSCNPLNGDCYCRTRGVTGKFYQLNTDFQYTFNLSKLDDTRLTQINFLNTPTSSDRDVDFTLNCSSGGSSAMINVTYKSKTSPQEKIYVTERSCDYFHIKFDHKTYPLAGKENTTFFVYVYNFKTPFMIQISFSQFPKIDLVHFFVTFFSCFLSLLLIAAALWKIKHKYDGYRRRQQMIVEMQQMASRPFSTIAVEIDRKFDSAVTDKRDHLDSVLRRRRKISNKPSAIAIEPLSDHKAAILTLLIQLPTGDLEYAPSGQSGLAVGSALVSIGSNRKQSLEHIKGDKPKIRKALTHSHPDACA
ncbi:unnamed protein product [Candidula unifasciata]|uniref:Attractin n=1 Tax=Candidula unifasciata TaxID=100452 RepID=A0A8S3YGI8_9EUPU|nr:unnamed protein product [Candidula unifasciata]